MRRFHFISGLPRSGSTLLSALLLQNPKFHAGMTSPLAPLFEGLIGQVSVGSELSSLVTDAQRKRFLRGLFDSYYAEHTQEVIFDTNRAWTAQLHALMSVFPEARVICLVRNVAWIMDSLERQFRQNPFENTRLFSHPAERATVYTRLDALAGANRLVGFPLQALREACYSEHADRVVIVDYDIFVRQPAEVMRLLYEFLEETPFEHDFNAVSYDAPKFDANMGLSGLHRVHSQVTPRQRETVLPPDLFERFAAKNFWEDLSGSRTFRIVQNQGA